MKKIKWNDVWLSIITLISIIAGVYFGVYKLGYGALANIAKAFDAGTVTAMLMLKNLVAIICAFPVSIIIASVGTLFGIFITEQELINVDLDNI